MEEHNLPVDVDKRPGATILSPRGDVDMSRAPSFREQMRSAQAERPARLVIDMGSVEYMDSSGLATLVEAMRNARGAGVELVLCALHPRVQAIFEIARLHQFFRIVPTVADAVGA